MISNYGVHWQREVIDWSRWCELIGTGYVKRENKYITSEANFNEHEGLYILHSRAGTIFSGRATRENGGLLTDLRRHKRLTYTKDWSSFSWFGVLPVVDGV